MDTDKSYRNLIDVKGVSYILLTPWVLRLFRIAALVLLVVMAAYGWHHHAIPGVSVKDPLMYTNLATYFFWVLWMMGVVFVALFFGRAWCTVCPLGWLNGVFSKFGLGLVVPAWLKNFIPVTLTLLVLQLTVYFFAIHRYPDYTASLLSLVILFAVLAGLVFRKRAFCTLLCPAGAVFSLYARVAPFQLRVKSKQTCEGCTSKACISGEETWKKFSLPGIVLFLRGHRPDCPVDLVPAEIETSAECTLCLHCPQNCPNNNIYVGRRLWLKDLAANPLTPSETLFFLVLLGMLTANFSKVYVELRTLIFWVPQEISLALAWKETGFYLLATPWVALVLPLLILLPGFIVLRLSMLKTSAVGDGAPSEMFADELPVQGRVPGLWNVLGRLALPCIPLLMAVHVILALVKLNAKGGYFPLVLADPTGVKSYLAMNVMQTVTSPGVLIPLDILKWITLLLLVAGYLLSLAGARVASLRHSTDGVSTRAFFAAATTVITLMTLLYGATIIRWLFIR